MILRTIFSRKKRAAVLLLFLLGAACMAGCQQKKEPVTKHGFYFDTVIQITLYDDSKEALIDDCFAMAEAFQKRISKTEKGSDIYEINHANGASVFVSEDTLALLEISKKYESLSGGSFDITIGALADLWDITNNPGDLPSQEAITEALSTTGIENIKISGNQVTLNNPDTRLELGGVAKGYMADQMKEYLNAQGIQEGFINLGGNVLLLGPKSSKEPYAIGIQKPFSPEGTPMFTVKPMDGSVVSSGVYQRYFEKDGRIYHHILDPSTGYPYENGLLSVTILCPSSADGDALSTTCFSLGLEQGMALVEELEDTEAVFITDTYELVFSSGMGEDIPYEVLPASP